MNRKYSLFIILAIVLAAVSSCNSDPEETEIPAYTNTAITSFHINANSKVLDNLDSVFFSIDLANARIFNADSMPYGTDVSHLVVNIGTSGCSALELTVPREGKEDTVINFLTNSTDSIDFSMGQAKIHVVSLDGTTSRDYDLRVNVHKMKPDSLYWNQLACRTLPSMFQSPDVQKTVLHKGKMLCMTAASGRYCVVTASNPGEDPATDDWITTEIRPQFTPAVETLASTDDALYVLADDGSLYSSTDNGSTWSGCNGTRWHNIIGGYGKALLGIEKSGDAYFTTEYPRGISYPAPDGFPISGSSQPVIFDSKWNLTPQLMILGGRTATGSLTGDVWGYDGFTWTKLSQASCPPRTGMTLFPYFVFRTNTTYWTVTEMTAWIALGGLDSDGDTHSTVYISIDRGLNWKVAGDLMQLPDYIPAMYGSQALVFPSVMQARSGSKGWTEFAPKELPRWLAIASGNSAMSRATRPITEWECPYIYLFGGHSSDGSLYNTVWRGAINRLTFKPLQ